MALNWTLVGVLLLLFCVFLLQIMVFIQGFKVTERLIYAVQANLSKMTQTSVFLCWCLQGWKCRCLDFSRWVQAHTALPLAPLPQHPHSLPALGAGGRGLSWSWGEGTFAVCPGERMILAVAPVSSKKPSFSGWFTSTRMWRESAPGVSWYPTTIIYF